jgi:dihydrofolate reductase
MQLFKKLTLGHTVIMGRKTFESLGRPLTGRRNLVVSRTLPAVNNGAGGGGAGYEVYPHLEAAFAAAAEPRPGVALDQVFVIGGGGVYAQALASAGRLYLSRLRREYEGDVYFPPLPSGWQKVSATPYGEFDLEIWELQKN